MPEPLAPAAPPVIAPAIDLAAVIAQVESGGDGHAMRFEPGLYTAWGTLNTARSDILADIADIHKCSPDTARAVACTSWGRYQILGENLYSGVCGLASDIFTFAGDAVCQRLCFDAFLRNRGVGFTLTDVLMDRTKREQLIAVYNGPGDVQTYWGEMKAAIAALGGPVVAVD